MYNQFGGALPVYAGQRYQRGGGVFSSLARLALPIAKTFLKETLKRAPRVVGSIIDNKNQAGNAILSGLKSAGLNTLRKTVGFGGVPRPKQRKRKARPPLRKFGKKAKMNQKGGGDIFST